MAMKQRTSTNSRDADKFVIRFPDDMREDFRLMAIKHNRSMNQELVEAATWWLNRQDRMNFLMQHLERTAMAALAEPVQPTQAPAYLLGPATGTYMDQLDALEHDCPTASVHIEAIRCIIDPARKQKAS